MASTPSPARSELPRDQWPTAPSADARLPPAPVNHDPLSIMRPSLGRRAARAVVRFVIIFCIGVAATLAWQSYGDEARQMIADSYPQLAWLAPQAAPQAASQVAPAAQPAPETVASIAPSAPAPDLQQLKEISFGLASMQQRMEQLAAGQQQMAGDIAKLQATEQDILQKISAPSPRPAPRPAAPPARKPVPLTTAPPLSQAPPVR